MSVLDEIKAAIGAAFLDAESPFLPAEVIRTTTTGGAYADGVTTTTTTDCRAFVDEYSDTLRAQLGIPARDVKIMVLQVNDNGESVSVAAGDTIRARGEDFRVVTVSQDPAQATWTAQGRPNG